MVNRERSVFEDASEVDNSWVGIMNRKNSGGIDVKDRQLSKGVFAQRFRD